MAATKSKSPPPSDFPTLDTSGRFAVDQLLRRHGFRIWKRPHHGEAVWLSPDGCELLFSQALKCLNRTAVDNAKYAQALYLDLKYK